MKEWAEPQGDFIIARKINHEEKSRGGIILPTPGGREDYEHLKTDKERKQHVPDRDIKRHGSIDTTRFEVLAVGPGQPTDVARDHEGEIFARKPMCAAVGDIVLVDNAINITVSGEVLCLFHDFAVLAKILNAGTEAEKVDPQHDFVFAKQAGSGGMQLSAGGIALPEQEDPTGLRSAIPDRWTALGVGEGPWVLRYERGKPAEYARRTMPVVPGDEFAFEGVGRMVRVTGAPMLVCQAFQIATRFIPMAKAQA